MRTREKIRIWSLLALLGLAGCTAHVLEETKSVKKEEETEAHTDAERESQEQTNEAESYQATFHTVSWEAESLLDAFAAEEAVGLLGFRNVPENGGKTRREYWIQWETAEEAEPSTVTLALPENYAVTEAVVSGEQIYLLAHEMASAEQSNPTGRYFVICDAEGEMVSQVALDTVAKAEDAQFHDLTADADGNLWMLESLRKREYVFSSQGELLYQLDAQELQAEGLISDGEQNVYEISHDTDGNCRLVRLDTDGKQEPFVLEGVTANMLRRGWGSSFLVLQGNVLYQYQIAEEQLNVVCSLTDLGVETGQIFDLAAMETGRVVILQGKIGDAAPVVVWMEETKLLLEEFENHFLTIACLEADAMLEDLVAAFNRSGSDYTVQIKEYYDSQQTDASREDALKRLNADLIDKTAGDLLDMVGLSGYANREQYVQLGLLEELNAWIEADEEIRREEYVTNIWEAYELNGGLYQLVSLFDVNTKIGAEEVFGNGYHLDLDWLFSKEHLENPQSVFGSNYLRDVFFHDVCVFWLSEEENLILEDDQMMQQLLSFAKGLSNEWKEEEGIWNLGELYLGTASLQTTGWSYGDGIGGRGVGNYCDIAAVMGDHSVTFADLDPQIRAIADDGEISEEDAEFLGSYAGRLALIGFPIAEGAGSSIVSRVSIGMCSASEKKEAAWEFLKYILSEEAQTSRGEFRNNSLPVRRSVWKQDCAENTDPANIKILLSNHGVEGEENYVLIPPLSEEMLENFNGLLAQMTVVDEVDPQLFSILTEEAEHFFQDECSEEEAVEAIQNRIWLYRTESE